MSDVEDYGCGAGSVVAILVVAACLLFLPLMIGPGVPGPPSAFVTLLIPVFLAVVFIILTHASK